VNGIFGTMMAGTSRLFAADGGEKSSPGPTDDFWYVPLGTDTPSAIRVTPEIAMKASAVYSCVSLIATVVASLDLRMYSYADTALKDGFVPKPNHPLEELIRYQANNRDTAVEFWEFMLFQAVLGNASTCGEAVAEIIPGARGAVDQLRPLLSQRLRRSTMRDYSVRYEYDDPLTNSRRVLLQDEVFRVPGPSIDAYANPTSVDMAADAIALGIAADTYAARVFSNKVNFGGFITHPGKMGEEGQTNFMKALMERFAGPQNFHRPILLQEGMKFEKASMDAQEAQLTEARKWQLMEVARRWHVPYTYIGLTDGMTKANVEQQALDFKNICLIPWTTRICQSIRRDLVVAKDAFFAAYDFDSLLQGDSAAIAAFATAMTGSGGGKQILTQNEVRVRVGYNRIENPEYDKLTTDSAKLNSPKASPGAQIEDQTTEARVARLVSKECAAIRKAVTRFADDEDAFRKAVSAFYSGHVSAAMTTLEIDRDTARAYCAGARDQVLAADEVVELLDAREESGAAEIIAALKEWKKDKPA
jgi:HK97 family phage portal protein